MKIKSKKKLTKIQFSEDKNIKTVHFVVIATVKIKIKIKIQFQIHAFLNLIYLLNDLQTEMY